MRFKSLSRLETPAAVRQFGNDLSRREGCHTAAGTGVPVWRKERRGHTMSNLLRTSFAGSPSLSRSSDRERSKAEVGRVEVGETPHANASLEVVGPVG